MPFRLTKTFAVDATFETMVPLAELENHRKLLQRSGVYVIHEKAIEPQEFTPYSSNVLYIGKAIGETIYSRCRKHRQAIAEHGLGKDEAKMRPGKRFQEYRARASGEPGVLLITAAFLAKDQPHLISCAEEYLTHTYEQQHGHKPRANTK